MKRIIVMIGVAFILMSCSKDDGDRSTHSKLIGNWNWTKSSGGFVGSTYTPQSTGEKILLEISNNTVKKYVNGNLAFESNHSIEFRNSSMFNEPREMIVFEKKFSL